MNKLKYWFGDKEPKGEISISDHTELNEPFKQSYHSTDIVVIQNEELRQANAKLKQQIDGLVEKYNEVVKELTIEIKNNNYSEAVKHDLEMRKYYYIEVISDLSKLKESNK